MKGGEQAPGRPADGARGPGRPAAALATHTLIRHVPRPANGLRTAAATNLATFGPTATGAAGEGPGGGQTKVQVSPGQGLSAKPLNTVGRRLATAPSWQGQYRRPVSHPHRGVVVRAEPQGPSRASSRCPGSGTGRSLAERLPAPAPSFLAQPLRLRARPATPAARSEALEKLLVPNPGGLLGRVVAGDAPIHGPNGTRWELDDRQLLLPLAPPRPVCPAAGQCPVRPEAPRPSFGL